MLDERPFDHRQQRDRFLLLKGIACTADGKYHRAIATLSQGLSKHSNSGLYAARGFARCKVGEFTEAIEDFDKSLVLRETDTFNIASINRHLSNIPYSKPQFVLANRGLARAYIGDNEKAIMDLDTAVDKDPENYLWYCYKAAAYLNWQDYKPAFDNVNHALEIKKNAVAYRILSVLLQKNNDDKAAQEVEKIIAEMNYDMKKDPTLFEIGDL